MKKVLSKIKELGALISLDDFGTGYSSLSHIRELPIDIIKIDRCFVIDLGKDDYAETFVRMVAELVDTIGVRMCVEGVEYDEQLQILKDMKKVQYIQGYYYDKPLTEEAFEKNICRMDGAHYILDVMCPIFLMRIEMLPSSFVINSMLSPLRYCSIGILISTPVSVERHCFS